jgi:hypothetical protein
MNEIKQKIIVKLLAFLLGGTSFVLQALISTNLSYAQEKKAQLQTQETEGKHTLGIGLGLEIPKKEFTIPERARIELLITTERNQLLLPVLLEKALEKRSILEPNTFALRIPLEKLTIEPFVRLGFASAKEEPPLKTYETITDKETKMTRAPSVGYSASLFNIGFGGFGRYPIKKFGYSNISILGGLDFNFSSLGIDKNEMNEKGEIKTTKDFVSNSAFSLGLAGGVGIEYFFTKNIAVSLDIVASLLNLLSEKTKTPPSIIEIRGAGGEAPIMTKTEERKSSHFFIGVENIGLRFLVFLYL